MSWSTFELRVRFEPLNRFKPSSKIFYWPFQGGTSFVDLICFCSVLCLLCLCARLFICALWSPAWKGLTSWLSFVVSNCEFVAFPLVSWVRCSTWLYRFLILAPLLTLLSKQSCVVLQNVSDFRSSLYCIDMKIGLFKVRGNWLPSYAVGQHSLGKLYFMTIDREPF